MKKDFKDELGKQEAEQPRSPSRCGNFKAQGWWLPRQAKMTRPTDTQKVIDQIESHAAIVREQKLHAEIKRLRAALQEIKILSWTTPEGHHIQDIARRALEGK